MTDEAKMWIGLGTFMIMPIILMAVAWLFDRLDRFVNRPTHDRPTHDRPTDLMGSQDVDQRVFDRPNP